jgi:hypothetical protein
MKKVIAIVSMGFALAIGGLGLSATPFTPAPQAAQAVSYRDCAMGMNGRQVCYQYNCNWWEYTFNGCRDGWVYMGNVWYAQVKPGATAVLTSA